MQVADVTKYFMSVLSSCDTGHRVVYDRTGRYNGRESTRTPTSSHREDGLYRMEAKIVGDTTNVPVFVAGTVVSANQRSRNTKEQQCVDGWCDAAGERVVG